MNEENIRWIIFLHFSSLTSIIINNNNINIVIESIGFYKDNSYGKFSSGLPPQFPTMMMLMMIYIHRQCWWWSSRWKWWRTRPERDVYSLSLFCCLSEFQNQFFFSFSLSFQTHIWIAQELDSVVVVVVVSE